MTVFGQETEERSQDIDRLELQMSYMIRQEAESREKQIRELRILIAQLESISASQSTVSREDLSTIVAELSVLKSEVEDLKRTLQENSRQLVSIDDEGFYEPSVSDARVNELSERLDKVTESLEQALAGAAPKVEANPSVNHGKITISGLGHEHYTSAPDGASSFISKRARLAIKGDINEYAQIKVQGEFAGTPKLLDGQIIVSPSKNWSLSIGQYKPAFGTDFLTSAASTPFVNRSLATGLTTDRDVGLSASFRNKFSSGYSVKLTAGLFNGAGINKTDANNHKNFVARAEMNLVGMFTLSPNIYLGKTNDSDSLMQDITDYGGSLTWAWRQEVLEAEYIWSEQGDVERYGWYIWGGHTVNVGLGFLQELQVLARYEQLEPDRSVDADRIDRLTLGTNLFIDEKYTKIQLNYLIDSEQGVSGEDTMFMGCVQVAF